MKKIFLSGRIKKAISKSGKMLESQLDISLGIKGKNLFVSGGGYSEYIASKVFMAIDMGFDADISLMLTNQNFMFEQIDIRKIVKKARVKEAIGRVIGTKGHTLKNLSKLLGCEIIVQDTMIGIIGESMNVTLALHALKSLVRGAPPSHVYKFIAENKGKIYESEEFRG